MRLAIVQATDGDSLREIPLLLCVGVRPVPPLMMNTLGNPHHSLLLGNPHHGLLGNLHHTWGIPITPGESPTRSSGESPSRGNPRHSLLLANPHHPGESPSRSSFFRISWLSCFSFPSIVEIIRFLLLWT